MERLKNNPIAIWFRKHKKLIQFQLLINAAFLIFIALASYVNIPLSGFKDYFIYFIHLLLLQLTVSGLLYLLTLNKWVFKVVFNTLFFVFSLISFWVYTQDISITDSLISVVLETKPTIVKDLLNLPYFLFIIATIFMLIYINKKYNKLEKRFDMFFFLAAFLAIGLFHVIEKNRINTLKARLPYNVYFGVKKYMKKDNYVLNNVSNKVQAINKNLKIIFVLGESVREDHLGLNGYERETTPLLKQQENIVSFKGVYTPYTYTNSSVPRIISEKSIKDKHLDDLTSIFSIFNRCDYQTHWIGNQELELSYKQIVHTNRKVFLIDSLRSVLSFNKAFDEKLLEPFKESIQTSEPQIVTLHMMGSHWYYDNRYPDNFRKFQPVTNSKYVPSQSAEQLINAYDNTIVYLDYFLNETINSLKDKEEPIIMIYLSDHGERLGENGKWLHAETAAEATNTACLVWYSKAFKTAFPNKVKGLLENKNASISTDFLYHSLLDLIQVKGIPYDASESIFQKAIK